MSDQPEASAPTDEAGSDFEPITSQEALNKIIGERIDRVKKQYSQFNELKAKAAKLDEIEAASKSELQKAQEANAQLLRELSQERRNTFAARKGVPARFVAGETEEEWEASVAELQEHLSALTEKSAPKPKPQFGPSGSGASTNQSRMDGMEKAAAAVRALYK